MANERFRQPQWPKPWARAPTCSSSTVTSNFAPSAGCGSPGNSDGAAGGAILTAHRDVGYPTLYRTSTTIELTERIVAQLLSSRDPTIDRQAIARSFTAAGGDVRETLFDLYDHFEHAERLPSRDEPDAAADTFPTTATLGTNCPILTVVTIARRVVPATLREPAYSLDSTLFCRSRVHFLGYRFSGIFPSGYTWRRGLPLLARDARLARR